MSPRARSHRSLKDWFVPVDFEPSVIALIGEGTLQERRYCLSGSRQTHKILGASCRVLRLISRIFESHTDDSDQTWLLKFRSELREIIDLGTIPLLALVAQRNPNSGIRCIAVWLMGRCHTILAAELVTRFRYDPNPRTRREVIRALRRLGDSEVLGRIAAIEPDPFLKAYAATYRRRTYDDRLNRFVRDIDQHEIAEPAPFEMADGVELTPHRPKPRWMIRLVLERIRRLLRGEAELG